MLDQLSQHRVRHLSPREQNFTWYQRFIDYVDKLVFSHNIYNNSLFISHHDIVIAYLLLYVNDITLTAFFDVIHESIMLELSYEFYMNDLGTLSYF